MSYIFRKFRGFVWESHKVYIDVQNRRLSTIIGVILIDHAVHERILINMLHTSSIKSDKSKISSVTPVLFKCYLFVSIMCLNETYKSIRTITSSSTIIWTLYLSPKWFTSILTWWNTWFEYLSFSWTHSYMYSNRIPSNISQKRFGIVYFTNMLLYYILYT